MPARRDTQRGSVIIVAMLALVALISLGGLAALSAQSGIAGSGHDRFRHVALYAAESGAAAGMDFLRRNIQVPGFWSALVSPNNDDPQKPAGIAGNGVEPGEEGNLFSPEMNAWYEVEVLNNSDDSGFAAGTDDDAQVILRVTGYGPNGTVAQVEWEVRSSGVGSRGRACASGGQLGQSEDGAGRNDCLQDIEGSVVEQIKLEDVGN